MYPDSAVVCMIPLGTLIKMMLSSPKETEYDFHV